MYVKATNLDVGKIIHATSDDKTVIRIGEEIRNHIGIQVGEKIVIRKHTESLINEEVNEKIKTISHPTLIISGSCINFEKELPRILNQLDRCN